MMTSLTSINKAGVHTVPLTRSTDAIGTVLRKAFASYPPPDDLANLLRQIDREDARH